MSFGLESIRSPSFKYASCSEFYRSCFKTRRDASDPYGFFYFIFNLYFTYLKCFLKKSYNIVLKLKNPPYGGFKNKNDFCQ